MLKLNELCCNEKIHYILMSILILSLQDLPQNMKTSWEVSKKPLNKIKNRYGNIVTCNFEKILYFTLLYI